MFDDAPDPEWERERQRELSLVDSTQRRAALRVVLDAWDRELIRATGVRFDFTVRMDLLEMALDEFGEALEAESRRLMD
jgi:hypothetical protein